MWSYGRNSLEAGFAEKARNLTRNDVDGGAGHETTHCWSRNEFDEPSET